MRGHKRSDQTVVADFCDSKHAASHTLWSSDVHALQIFLYFDEVELCNPLGSSRKIHKLGMYAMNWLYCDILVYSLYFIGCFYFTIGNIHQKFRSTLKSIQLLALAKNEDIRKYGMSCILKSIVDDIAKLEKVYFNLRTKHAWCALFEFMLGCDIKHY